VARALAVILGSVLLAHGAASISAPRTFIIVHGKRMAYVEFDVADSHGDRKEWAASWGPGGLAWVETYPPMKHTYFSGCEGESDNHRYGVARLGREGRWRLATFPGFTPVATAVPIDALHMRVMNAGRLVATTQGPDGPVAALAWETVHDCR
jgi:hypothetical protein